MQQLMKWISKTRYRLIGLTCFTLQFHADGSAIFAKSVLFCLVVACIWTCCRCFVCVVYLATPIRYRIAYFMIASVQSLTAIAAGY